MKKTIIFALLFVLIASASLFAQREKGLTGRFVPADGNVLLFAGQNNRDSDEFVKIIKKVPAGFMFYTALADLEGLENQADFGAGATSGSYLVKKYPGTALQIGLYLVNSMDSVIDGSLDGNIEKLAKWIKAAKVPVFLRIGYEFDYPENRYEPEKYVKAFRHIVEKMDSLNVTNVAYVWHSYASLNPRGIEAWYPGDDYVDWCAISYFASPQWIPMMNFAKKHSKPVMIAESAPMLGPNLKEEKKPEWYRSLFRFIETQNNVKALSYINCDWDAQPMFKDWNWGNSKINASAEIEKLFKEKIFDKRFVYSDRLYDVIDFKKGREVLIVFCHPDNKNSFNVQILEAFTKTLKKNGVEYKVRDLYAMKFNPVLSKKDLGKLAAKKFPKEIEKERNMIKEADTLVFIYPVWWAGMPAMMKGYIDRVFTPGFAFDFQNGKNMQPSIKYKKAIIINTMAMSEKTFHDTRANEAFEIIYDDLIFSFFGLKTLVHKYFHSVHGMDEETFNLYIREVEKIADTIK
ncbi:MAG: NAD(P)H-dependent oxidoreductase [Endomicrobia bacterium]|nr:NAD(P)H-dependent oxidoreductase [Endomicrobiia bacterium]